MAETEAGLIDAAKRIANMYHYFDAVNQEMFCFIVTRYNSRIHIFFEF